MKEKSVLIFCCLILLILFFVKNNYAKNIELKPEIALIQEQGGRSTGELNPEFVLYNNGFVIFERYPDGYFCAKLTKEEKDILIKKLKIESLFELKEDHDYNISKGLMIFDGPTDYLYIWSNKITKKISSHGDYNNVKFVTRGLDDLINALKILSSFNTQNSIRWIPKKIEVNIIGFYKTKKHMPWPSNWPILRSTEWTKGKNGVYTRVFNRDELNLLKEIEKKNQDEIAVLLDDELWGVNYRFPFPKESIWITDIRKYDINYYSDEINKRAKELEAERIKKHLPPPADKFYDYTQAAKQIKKKLGLKYQVNQ